MNHFFARRLKLAILLPLALSLLGLLVIFTYHYYKEEKDATDAYALENFEAVQQAYDVSIQADTEKLATALQMIVRDEVLSSDLLAQDKDKLLVHTQDLFAEWSKKYGVTHWHFFDSKRKTILRAHDVERSDDTINRYTLKQAEATKMLASGVEHGANGSLMLRVVQPWFYHEQLIGYVELSEEIDHILQAIQKIHRTNLYLLIDKKHFQREIWQANMARLNRADNWALLPDHVLAFQNASPLPPQLLSLLRNIKSQQINVLFDFSVDQQIFKARSIPLFDASNSEMGYMLMSKDFTHALQENETDVWFLIIAGLALVTSLLGLFTFIINRLNDQLIKSAKQIEEANQKMYAVFEGAHDGVILLNQKGFFNCNQNALALFGFENKKDFLACHPAQLSPITQPDGQDSFIVANEKIKTAFETGENHFEWIHLRRDGVLFPAEISLSRFKYGDEDVLQATVRDISERKQLENALRQSETLWSFALEGAGDCVWDWNVLTGKVVLSKAGAQMFGYDSNAAISDIHAWHARLADSDKARWQLLLRQFFHDKAEKFSIEYQVCCMDNSYKWVLTRGMVAERSADGRVTRMVGVHTDIHQRKQVEERLALFGSIFEAADRAIGIADGDCILRYVNPALAKMFGYTENEIIGQHMAFLRTESAVAQLAEILETTRKQQSWNGLLSMRRKDGSEFLSASSMGAILDEKGNHRFIFNIFYDYTPELQHQEELRLAKEQADAASYAKSEFLANMSHEIRTPMNAIIGLSHLTLQTELSKKQYDYLNKIYHAAHALLGIINDILDFSKIEAGKLKIEQIPFELETVINNLSTIVSENARKKQLELLIDVAHDVPNHLIGDPLRLGQILINLVGNAIKFTEHGEILVRARLHRVYENDVILLFSVKDTGIGMTDEQMARLFQSFSQADSSTTRKFGGTGLGLSISKRLVEMMHGKIWVESSLNTGSCFNFMVKLGKDDLHKAASAISITYPDLRGLRILLRDDQPNSANILQQQLKTFGFSCVTENEDYDLVIINHELNLTNIKPRAKTLWLNHGGIADVTVDTQLTKPYQRSDLLNAILHTFGYDNHLSQKIAATNFFNSEAVAKISGAHLLLVEDNDINQQIAQELLEKIGISVVIANNGQEGLDRLNEEAFDGVLMDIQMPVMDGLTATRILRKSSRFQELPIIAMTANAMVSDQVECLSAGLNDHIAKPFEPSRLFETLAKWIKPRHLTSVPLAIAEPDSLAEALPHIEHLNVKDGLLRVGGSVDTYYQILQKFVAGQGNTLTQIEQALAVQDYSNAQQLTHQLKGVSGNIGAEEVHIACKTLEQHIKLQQSEQAKSLVKELMPRLQELFDAITQALADKNWASDLLKRTLSQNELRHILQTARQKLTQFDSSVEETLLLLQGRISPVDQAQLDRLQQCVAQYEYEQAITMLDEWLEALIA